MDRFYVNAFATLQYGEDPRYGWRVIMCHESRPYGGILLASFATEAEAQSMADTLNVHDCLR